MDIKYTKDGKKVVVIGKLNSQEMIVQEVFVTADGAEVPSGEHFLVKALHDEPLKSYREIQLEKLEDSFSRRKGFLSREMVQLERSLKTARAFTSNSIHVSKLLNEHIGNEVVKTFLDFLEGNITHVLVCSYHPVIMTLEECLTGNSEHNRDSLKLLTLFGENKGFEWRLSEYSDGSGGYSEMIPCRSHDDAINKLERMIITRINRKTGLKGEKTGVQEWMMQAKEKYDLTVPVGQDLIDYYEKLIDQNTKHIDKAEAVLSKQEDEQVELLIKLDKLKGV